MDISALRMNVRRFYLSSFLGGWSFATGFLVFYYREVGFSYLQILIVGVVYKTLNFLLEIPTGALADLWSRKWTVTLGHAISGASFLIVILRPDAYWMFLLWAVLSAICTTLNSGSTTAIMYDTMLALGKEDRFARLQGRTFAIDLITQTATLVVGGILAERYGFRLVLLLSGIGGLLQALLLGGLTEPPIFAQEALPPNGRGADRSLAAVFLRHIASSFRVLAGNVQVRWVVAYGFFAFALSQFFPVVWQPYLADLGYNSRMVISAFSAGVTLITAIAAIAVGEVKPNWRGRPLLVLVSVGVTVPFVMMGGVLGRSAIPPLALFALAAGAANVVLPDLVNTLIPSDRRATILSAQNQLYSIGYAITAVALGRTMDRLGLSVGSLAIGILAVSGLAILLTRMPKVARDAPPEPVLTGAAEGTD